MAGIRITTELTKFNPYTFGGGLSGVDWIVDLENGGKKFNFYYSVYNGSTEPPTLDAVVDFMMKKVKIMMGDEPDLGKADWETKFNWTVLTRWCTEFAEMLGTEKFDEAIKDL